METVYNSQSEVASHTEVPFEARHAVIEQMKLVPVMNLGLEMRDSGHGKKSLSE